MNNSNLATARLEYAFHAVHRRIVATAIKAKLDLGLDADPMFQEYRAQYVGPTYVDSVIIHATCPALMYDHVPDIVYSVDVKRGIQLPPCTLDDAMASLDMAAVLTAWSQADDEDSDEEPVIRFIELCDNLGNTIAEARPHYVDLGVPALRWDPMPDAASMTRSLSEADCLQREAALEARWDNFETARNLREKADAILRRLSIVKHRGRLATSH